MKKTKPYKGYIGTYYYCKTSDSWIGKIAGGVNAPYNLFFPEDKDDIERAFRARVDKIEKMRNEKNV